MGGEQTDRYVDSCSKADGRADKLGDGHKERKKALQMDEKKKKKKKHEQMQSSPQNMASDTILMQPKCKKKK